MTAVLPGWNPEMERRFKELLYRFLEEVHATKAALYLLAEDGRYLLVTQYGFGRRDLLAADFGQRAPVVQLARQLRNRPRGFNEPPGDRELARYLEGAGTARLLLVPLSAGSRLVGFVDVRDKGRRRPFTADDERRAADIAAALLGLIRRSALYPDLGEPAEPQRPAPEPAGPAGAPLPRRRPAPARGLDRGALPELLGAITTLARLPGVGGVAVTLAADGRAHTVVAAVVRPGPDELEAIRRHHAGILGTAAPDPGSRDWTIDQTGPVDGEGGPRDVAVSGPLLGGNGWHLAGSVLGGLGSSGPSVAFELLRRQVGAVAAARAAARRARRAARALLEPGERRYPELRRHSEAVSRLAWRLAAALGGDDETVEDAALAGLLHDVGMRELEYERIYRHPDPGAAERRLYHRHPIVGERIAAAAGLDRVAAAVRHHHERWDGGGYPDRLRGEAIPPLARIVHVAEVFDVLTSDGSYRRPVGRSEALAILRKEAGRQFDPDAVRALADLV